MGTGTIPPARVRALERQTRGHMETGLRLETTSAGERSESPYGAQPAGFLTYTSDGRVSALISYDGRKSLSMAEARPKNRPKPLRLF